MQSTGMRPILASVRGCVHRRRGWLRPYDGPTRDHAVASRRAGLGNGVANLHNARRAGTPLINLVGDHAVHHVPYDAPLTVGHRRCRASGIGMDTHRALVDGLAGDGADAVLAASTPNPEPLGNVATLIVPADCAWGAGHRVESKPKARRAPSAAGVRSTRRRARSARRQCCCSMARR